MALKRVDERLSRLSTLVEKWNNSGNVPRIERDMALEELRRIYDELLDYTPQQAETPVVEAEAPAVEEPEAEADEEIEHSEEHEAEEVVEVVAPAVAAAVVTAHEDVGDAFDDALDIDALLGLSGEDSIEEAEATRSIEEPAEEIPEEQPEPEANTEAEANTEESAPERPIGGGLFDIDDIPVRTKSGRKMISLYDAPIKTSEPAKESASVPAEEVVVVEKVEVEPAPAPAPMPAPAPQPTPAPQPAPAPAPMPAPAPREEEAPQRLGDVIAKNVTTLADKMAEEQPTAAYNRITDIRKAIGLNDKFLMIRDLFGGDANLYEDTINHLNEYDDLDECMIFIVENFRWNPDSEGAKLLVSLLERKLS
ncbi:MAG: hypothetical protein IIX38_06475 [Alistipes sp.]|nr:hypothetical protein [Alistipes sp.]